MSSINEENVFNISITILLMHYLFDLRKANEISIHANNSEFIKEFNSMKNRIFMCFNSINNRYGEYSKYHKI